MGVFMRDNSLMEFLMDLENILIKMAQFMKVNLKMEALMDTVKLYTHKMENI